MGAHLIDEYQAPGIDVPNLPMRHRLLKNSSPSASHLELFSSPVEASYRSTNCRFAHPHSQHGEQELSSLGVGSPRPLLEVFGEQLSGLLV